MQNPFAKRASSADPAGKRRSTRIDFVCPIVVSGRDSTGEVFREETQTSTVNLHGCKMRLEHPVLVGMVVTLESPRVRATAKGICVHAWEPGAGQSTREVAVQLLKPQNFWGLEDPPADWHAMAQALVEGRTLRIDNIASLLKTAAEPDPALPKVTTPPAGALNPTAPPVPAASTFTAAPASPPQAAPPAPVIPKAAPAPAVVSAVAGTAAAPQPAPPDASTAASAKVSAGITTVSTLPVASTPASPAATVPKEPPASASAADPHLAELEDRSWQMMDSVLQVLRDQTEELVRGTLEEFRHQVEAMVQDAEDRLKQRTERSYDEVESSINTLRRDMAEQMAHRSEEIVESAKEALHARVEEMLTAMLSSSQNKSPKSPSGY